MVWDICYIFGYLDPESLSFVMGHAMGVSSVSGH